MRSKNSLIAVSILFVVLAVVFGIIPWGEVSLPAKIAFFACGFGSGICIGQLILRRA